MRSAEFFQACLDAGMPHEMAMKALKAFDVQVPHIVGAALETVRAKARDRQQKHRMSRDKRDQIPVTEVTSGNVMSRDKRDEPRERVREITSNLGSRTDTSEANASSVIRPLAISKPNGFARFWEAYPSKVAKRTAEQAYLKALKRITGPDPPGVILAGVARAKLSRKWREGFVQNPATWLNGNCWDDEPEPEKPHERPDAKLQARYENYGSAFAGFESAARNRG